MTDLKQLPPLTEPFAEAIWEAARKIESANGDLLMTRWGSPVGIRLSNEMVLPFYDRIKAVVDDMREYALMYTVEEEGKS